MFLTIPKIWCWLFSWSRFRAQSLTFVASKFCDLMNFRYIVFMEVLQWRKKRSTIYSYCYIVHRYLQYNVTSWVCLQKKVHMLVWKYFYRLSFPSLFSSSSFLVWRMDNLFLKSIFMLIEQFSDFQFQSTMFGNHIN